MDHPTLDRLQLYVDQRVTELERLNTDRHLAICPDCAARVQGLRQLVSRLAELDDMSLPPSFARDLTEEVAPSPEFSVEPPHRRLWVQAAVCLILLLTCGALLTIIDTPVTDPSDDVLGAVDMLLGSPFQEQAPIVAVLAIMAVAGLGVIACLIAGMPAVRPRRPASIPSRSQRQPRH
jgi:anti-sigma factor RsiW